MAKVRREGARHYINHLEILSYGRASGEPCRGRSRRGAGYRLVKRPNELFVMVSSSVCGCSEVDCRVDLRVGLCSGGGKAVEEQEYASVRFRRDREKLGQGRG